MSITVNVENVGLKELVALYYNDNGTIRDFKEIWTNDGDEVKCLFRKLTPLTWTAKGEYATVNSVTNNGYSVNFKDLTISGANESNNGIRSNSFSLSQGKVITVDFTRTSTNYILVNFIALLDSKDNVVQKSDTIESTTTSNTVTLNVASSGEYILVLCTVLTDGSSSWHQSTVDAKITIE